MVLGQLYIRMKNGSWLLFNAIHKNQFNVGYKSNVEMETRRLLENNIIKKNLHQLGLEKNILKQF